MSRTFAKSTSNYMDLGINALSPLISGASAVSFHCWARANTLTAANVRNFLLAIQLTNTETGIGICTSSTPALRAIVIPSTGHAVRTLTGSTTLTTATWYSLGVVVDIANDAVAMYVNGVAETVTGTSLFTPTTYTPGTPTTRYDALGCDLNPPTTIQYGWDGEIVTPAVWNSALTGTDFANLAAGTWPGYIATSTLVWLAVISGLTATEPSMKGSITGTITGTLSSSTNEPQMHRPWFRDPHSDASVGLEHVSV